MFLCRLEKSDILALSFLQSYSLAMTYETTYKILSLSFTWVRLSLNSDVQVGTQSKVTDDVRATFFIKTALFPSMQAEHYSPKVTRAGLSHRHKAAAKKGNRSWEDLLRLDVWKSRSALTLHTSAARQGQPSLTTAAPSTNAWLLFAVVQLHRLAGFC